MVGQLALLVVPALFFAAVLFGANPVNQFWGTLVWALLTSCLLLLPAHLLLADGYHLLKVVLQSGWGSNSERCVWCGSLMTLFGAWLGAFPILLDWNRPWQVWPIPSCIGAIAGSLTWYLGYGVLQYCYRWRRKHSPV